MCQYAVPPGYRRKREPISPKLAGFTGIIDAILEADKQVHVKQRHTVIRILERLREEHGFTGGYTIVRNYVNKAAIRQKEMFVPLAHLPGHAQVDFGEADGYIGGKLVRFLSYLPYRARDAVDWDSLQRYRSRAGESLQTLATALGA